MDTVNRLVQVRHSGCTGNGLAMQIAYGSRMHDYLSRPHTVDLAVKCSACWKVMAADSISVDELHPAVSSRAT